MSAAPNPNICPNDMHIQFLSMDIWLPKGYQPPSEESLRCSAVVTQSPCMRVEVVKAGLGNPDLLVRQQVPSEGKPDQRTYAQAQKFSIPNSSCLTHSNQDDLCLVGPVRRQKGYRSREFHARWKVSQSERVLGNSNVQKC